MRKKRTPLHVLIALFVCVPLLAALAGCVNQQGEPMFYAQPAPQEQEQAQGSRALGDTGFTNVVATGSVRAGSWQVAGARTAISVTNGSAIAATGSYQPLTSGGTVTATITAGDAGRLLVLVNTSATTINIQDTGIQKLSAAAALGQYDALVLWSDGTNWIEISRSDN